MENITATIGGTAKFALGFVVMTPGIEAALAMREMDLPTLTDAIIRHQCGDWGSVDAHDARENDRALRHGMRLLSAFPYTDDARADNDGRGRTFGNGVFWIITEADRSATTVLLPEEY